jgi:hypothetical protein
MKAVYHNPGYQPHVLNVLRQNADGTVDLCNDNGELVVGKCPTEKSALAHNAHHAWAQLQPEETKTVSAVVTTPRKRSNRADTETTNTSAETPAPVVPSVPVVPAEIPPESPPAIPGEPSAA